MSHDLDRHIGRRVQLRRRELGMDIPSLALATGCSADQLQAIEAGTKRLPAALLIQMATALDVPLRYFFEGPYDFDPDED